MSLLLTIWAFLGPTFFANFAPLTDQDDVRGMAAINIASLDRAVNLHVENKQLVAEPVLKLKEEEGSNARLVVPKLRAIVIYKSFTAGIDLMLHYVNNPSVCDIYESLSSVGGQIHVWRGAENVLVSDGMNFTQDPPPISGELAGESAVRLQITHENCWSDKKDVDLQINADNFEQLRAEHAAEVDLYLRPVIAHLGQEKSVFAVSPITAWQVLGRSTPVSPAVMQQVAGFLKDTDAENFVQRQRATTALRALGQSAADALHAMDRSKLSEQQKLIADSIFAEFSPLSDHRISSLRDDPSFLLDIMLNDDEGLRTAAAKRLAELLHRKIDVDRLKSAEQIDALRVTLIPNSTTQPGKSKS